MKKLLAGLVVGFLLVLIGTIAQATTITAIYGSGNSDDGWTSSTTDGITLALRAKVRYVTGKSSSYSSVTYDGDSTYNAETGESTSGVAAWNFDFSIEFLVFPIRTLQTIPATWIFTILPPNM